MADHLRQVIGFVLFFWGLAGFAQAPATSPVGPFSHQLHLKLKPDCNSCHTAAAKSTSVADNLLPTKEACQPCHQNAAISSPPPVSVAKFSHQQHMPFGSVGPVIQAAVKAGTYLGKPNHPEQLETSNNCVSCHRGVMTSTAPSHDLIPQMADCLTCHNKIDVPYSCVTCHDKGAAQRPLELKPASHVNGFVDIHTTPKVQKEGCQTCHGKQFTCMGCHSG